jgi:hypothetical protein
MASWFVEWFALGPFGDRAGYLSLDVAVTPVPFLARR